MNYTQYLTLKMGNKYIFKEPLQNLRLQRNSNYMNSNYQKNNYYSPNNYNINTRNNHKKDYKGMDVIPKFIANENMKEINKELLNRMQNKKATFTKILKTYFSGGDENFANSIQEIETEMNTENLSLESTKKDYEGFKDLISFINDNRTNPKLTAMKNTSLDEYKAINDETKKQILEGINQNKELFYQKLNLNNYINKNNNYNLNNNPYVTSNQRQRAKTTNVNNNSNKNVGKTKNMVTKDQVELFKILIGNQNIPNNEVLSYFDSNNNKVMVAAEKYFKKKYGLDYLTLQFLYPNQQKLGIKVHKFKFIGELSGLFMAAHNDYLSLNNPRLYLENGREIKLDKKIKCIGALGLENNSKIKVII